MPEMRFEKPLSLPEVLEKSTLYLTPSSTNDAFLDITVTGQDDPVPRRVPNETDIIGLINDNPPTDIPADHVTIKLPDGTDSNVNTLLNTAVGTTDSRVRCFSAKLVQSETVNGWELSTDPDVNLNVTEVTVGSNGRLSLALKDGAKHVRSAVAQFHSDSQTSSVFVTASPVDGAVTLKATSDISGHLTYRQDGTFTLETPEYLQGTVTVEKAVDQLDSISVNHGVPTNGDMTVTRMLDAENAQYFGDVVVNKASDTSVRLSTIDDLIFRIDYVDGQFVHNAPSELGITCVWDPVTSIMDVNIPDTPGYLANNLDFTYDGDEMYRTEIQDKTRTKISFAWIDTGFTRITEPGPLTKIAVFLNRRDKTAVLNPFNVRFDCGRGELPFGSLYIPGAVIEVNGIYEVMEPV